MSLDSAIGPIWAGTATALSPILRALIRYRATRGKEIPARTGERRGVDLSRRPEGPLLWLHAASVGETLSLLPVLASLAAQRPGMTTLVTTGTVTSATLLTERLRGLGLSDKVFHRFAPLDVPAWVARFLDHWRPAAAGFVESELWPNILGACRSRGIPTMLINARMSARSHATWARVPWAARPVLRQFARIHARSEEDATRLRDLGAAHLEVLGDLKLAAPDLPADPRDLAEWTARLAGRPVFLAASTHPGEEVLIREVHESLQPRISNLLTITVPRHPERGAELAELLGAPRRQAGQPPPDAGIWIADTLGELGLWYRLCHAAFVGRSLIPPGGGQNPLEPARLGCAIATGPHTGNFNDHVALLRAANGLEIVADVPGLVRFVERMLSDPDARGEMGARARAAVDVSRTLPEDTARALLELMDRA